MNFVRCVDDSAARVFYAVFVRWCFGFTGHREAHEICGRSTASERSREATAPYRFGKPADNCAFNGDSSW